MASSLIPTAVRRRRALSSFAAGLRPGFVDIALLAVLLLLTGALGAPVRAEGPGLLAIDFFLHLADGPLGAPELTVADDSAVTDGVLLGAIPLRIMGEDEGAGGWRMVAGANGRYTVPVTDRLTMVARAGVTTTDFVDPGTADKAVTTAATEFRYTRAGWTVGLQPGFEIVQRHASIAQREPSVEARLSKSVAGGLSIAGSGRYAWREASEPWAMDRETALGRLGLAYRKPHQPRIDMSYTVRREVAESDLPQSLPYATLSTGPSLSVAMPIGENIDLAGSYYFSSVAHDGAQGPTQHRLGLGMSWDLRHIAPEMKLSATYRCEVIDRAGVRGETRHAGTVNFGFNF